MRGKKSSGTTALGVAASVLLLACARADAAVDPACLAATDAAPPAWNDSRCPRGPAASPVAVPPAGLVPGDLAYYWTISLTPPRSVLSAPLPTYTFTPVGTSTRAILAMDFDNPGNVLYGIDTGTRELGTIDLVTGAFTVVTVVQGIPAGLNVRGLRFDPTSPAVYLLFGGDLYTLDIATGSTRLIGPTAGLVIDIAIDNSGQMYGHDIANDELLRIDKTDATSTVVGPTGLSANFAQGMDFDPSDNTLYGFAFVESPIRQGHLVRFDLATGAATILATTPDDLEGAIKVAVPATPVANAVDAAGNGVFEPGETAVMAPTWRNNGAGAVTFAGALDAFTGPAGPTYTIVDGSAGYSIAGMGTAACGADCYALAVAGARPATHWDSTVRETVSPGAISPTWTLHVGGSFADVPASSGFYRFVETILHHNVTGGCTATQYCPADSTTREQMAVFVLVSREPAGYTPPVCGSNPTFSDVPASSPFCPWIEELARRAVVGGCGSGAYCPSSPVNREQMAIFVLRTLDPALDPPACGTPVFADVPASSPFCRWIEELARRGVVSGCGGGNYCPAATVTRDQMAVFLTATFSLALYGL